MERMGGKYPTLPRLSRSDYVHNVPQRSHLPNMKRRLLIAIPLILVWALASMLAWKAWTDETLETLSKAPFTERVTMVDGVDWEVSMLTYRRGAFSVVELGQTRLIVPYELYPGRYLSKVRLTMNRGGWSAGGLDEKWGAHRTEGTLCTYQFRGHTWLINSGILAFPGFQIDLTRERSVVLIGVKGAAPKLLRREPIL
jgi:hypothetical protein